MANPLVAALFGALGGGYEGHQQDVAKRERLADRTTLARTQRQNEILRRLQMLQQGVREGQPPMEQTESVGSPEALPGISRVPAPDPNMEGGKEAALQGLSPSQSVKRQQEMVDEDYGAPSGNAPIATAETPHNLASRAPAPSRSRYLPLGTDAYLDTTQTPEARASASQQAALQQSAEQRRRHLEGLGYNPSMAAAGSASQPVYEKMVEAKAITKPVTDPYGGLSREQWLQDIRDKARIGAQFRPTPQKPDPQQVVVSPDGVVVVDKTNATSRPVAAPGVTTGGANPQLQAAQRNPLKAKAIQNRTQLRTIDEALAAVAAHPDAVGLNRGIPIVGDMVNQRWNREGIGARAAISDIGSLVLHDRSGAAITVSEFPRLAPFVPSIKDTPEAVTAKLTRLRQLIEAETQALEAGGGSGAAPNGWGVPGGTAGSSSSGVASKYGITPSR